MRLTSKSEYALLAVIEIALNADEGAVNSRAIAERRGIPLNFLEQILHELRKAGIISSLRGPKGGFVLAQPAAEITVLDVVEAVDGPLVSSVCAGTPEHEATCVKAGTCAAASVWGRATEVLREELEATNLETLAAKQFTFDDSVIN